MRGKEEEDKEMSALLERKYAELKVDVAKVRARAEVLRVDDDGALILDRNNPEHCEWFNDDEN